MKLNMVKPLKAIPTISNFHTGNAKNEEKAKDGIVRYIFSLNAILHPVEFKPENLGTGVNSTQDDYWPSLSADEQSTGHYASHKKR